MKPEWKLDGVNLLPYLDGKNTGAPHETLYWRFGEQMAIRQGDWKLVRYDNAGTDHRPQAVQPRRGHRRGERPGGEGAGEGPRPRSGLAEVERGAGAAAVGRRRAGEGEEEQAVTSAASEYASRGEPRDDAKMLSRRLAARAAGDGGRLPGPGSKESEADIIVMTDDAGYRFGSAHRCYDTATSSQSGRRTGPHA